MFLPIAIGVVVVLAVWFAVAVAVALFIGRAVRMGETKHRDSMFLRDLPKESKSLQQAR